MTVKYHSYTDYCVKTVTLEEDTVNELKAKYKKNQQMLSANGVDNFEAYFQIVLSSHC